MEVGDIFEFRNSSDYKASLCLTVDVEDWFHILGSPAVPGIECWSGLESRLKRNLDKLFMLFDSASAKCTFFWLGWLAERHKELVRRCQSAGHEIACHGYAHVLAYEVGEQAFREDISQSKAIIEDIIGEPVRGFRAPGFGITSKSLWAFDVIKECGYQYDNSIFPAAHSHGGIPEAVLGPHFIETRSGKLLEIPSSVVEVFGRRTSLFGGGYLRLATRQMIAWGLDRLQAASQPLVVYVHPREIDPHHPRLPLSLTRRFKCYVRLKSTWPKLEWLCQDYQLCSMLQMAENFIRSSYYEKRAVPIVNLRRRDSASGPEAIGTTSINVDGLVSLLQEG
jgi:polysaccharide deacetylase family protein (PEP-CTERM system associated)